jgi:hypothetical protein
LTWQTTANYFSDGQEVYNYGYFSVDSPNGLSKSGWLLNMQRNPIDRIAKLKLLEKVAESYYYFSGNEELIFTSFPEVERDDTFYYLVNVRNSLGNDYAPLITNASDDATQRGLEVGIYNSGHPVQPNKILVQLISNASGNKIRVISNSILSIVNLNQIEIYYDGSSSASGVTMYLNGNLITTTTLDDTLTGTIVDNSEFKVGRRIDEGTDRGLCQIESFSFQVNSIAVFQTDCTNDGTVCKDISGNGNDGTVNLRGTSPSLFFRKE